MCLAVVLAGLLLETGWAVAGPTSLPPGASGYSFEACKPRHPGGVRSRLRVTSARPVDPADAGRQRSPFPASRSTSTPQE